jgi:lysyl-tRNA synthetase class II
MFLKKNKTKQKQKQTNKKELFCGSMEQANVFSEQSPGLDQDKSLSASAVVKTAMSGSLVFRNCPRMPVKVWT